MGDKLPARESELYRRCDEILHYVWDPIGVAGVPEARDEYYSYLPRVFALVSEQADSLAIAAYLLDVQTEHMCLPGTPDHAKEVAEALTHWRTVIWEHHASLR